jgi:hypothetical protein
MITKEGEATTPPVTIPVVSPMDATAVLLLVHVPPVIASESVMAEPVHTVEEPVIGGGAGFTVTTADTTQLAV